MDVLVDAAPFVSFLAIYLATLSNNFSIAHDSINYLLAVTEKGPALHPHHLLYQPMLRAYSSAVSSLGLGVSMSHWLEGLSAIAGAFTLQGGYLILRHRLGVGRATALFAVCASGFSFAIWYYSVAIEIYIFPLALLTWAFYLLSSPKLGWGSVVLAAGLHAIAILTHQLAILFSCVPIVALMSRPGVSLSKRARTLALYSVVGTMLVWSVYLGIAAHLGRLDSVQEFAGWFLGYLTRDDYWSPASSKTVFLAVAGLGRAFVGGHFLFGLDPLRSRLQSTFSNNSLEDEIFLVRGIPDWALYALCALAVCFIVGLVAVTLLALRTLWRGESVISSRSLVLLLAWLTPHVVFFIAWDASNVDFWVAQVFIFWILLAACLEKKQSRSPAAYLALLAATLFVLNGFGSVFPAHDPENDYYRAYVVPVATNLTEADFLLIGDSWPIADHLRFYADVPFDALDHAP